MPDRELNEPAFYTNYGKSVIDFAAPGGNVDFNIYPGPEPICTIVITRPCWVFDLVFSTGSRQWVDDGDGIPEAGEFVFGYYWSAGTSMAAPHAAGVAALIVGRNGGTMKPAQLTQEMRQTADRFGKSGKDASYGKGVVDAYDGDG